MCKHFQIAGPLLPHWSRRKNFSFIHATLSRLIQMHIKLGPLTQTQVSDIRYSMTYLIAAFCTFWVAGLGLLEPLGSLWHLEKLNSALNHCSFCYLNNKREMWNHLEARIFGSRPGLLLWCKTAWGIFICRSRRGKWQTGEEMFVPATHCFFSQMCICHGGGESNPLVPLLSCKSIPPPPILQLRSSDPGLIFVASLVIMM